MEETEKDSQEEGKEQETKAGRQKRERNFLKIVKEKCRVRKNSWRRGQAPVKERQKGDREGSFFLANDCFHQNHIFPLSSSSVLFPISLQHNCN